MNELESEDIKTWLTNLDLKDNMTSPKVTSDPRFHELMKTLTDSSVKLGKTSYCVVGIDILGYSQYKFSQQAYIPVLFDLLLDEAIKHARESEYLTFNAYTAEAIRERFIPTGDGGFLVLKNPLEGLLFSLTFAAILHLYNAHSFYPGLRYSLGPVRVRYCLTHDKVYKYRKNYFGPGIITNARIMSRDKLDRCLVDENIISWFLEKINGIESLRVFTIRDLIRKMQFNPFNQLPEGQNYFMSSIISDDLKEDNVPRILSLSTQKIGIITAKDQPLNVYNLYIQLAKSYNDESNPSMRDNYVINLGSLNTSGLNDSRNSP